MRRASCEAWPLRLLGCAQVVAAAGQRGRNAGEAAGVAPQEDALHVPAPHRAGPEQGVLAVRVLAPRKLERPRCVPHSESTCIHCIVNAMQARGVTAEHMPLIAGLHPHLTRLSLKRCRGVTDAGLADLAPLTRLADLSIARCYQVGLPCAPHRLLSDACAALRPVGSLWLSFRSCHVTPGQKLIWSVCMHGNGLRLKRARGCCGCAQRGIQAMQQQCTHCLCSRGSSAALIDHACGSGR